MKGAPFHCAIHVYLISIMCALDSWLLISYLGFNGEILMRTHSMVT